MHMKWILTSPQDGFCLHFQSDSLHRNSQFYIEYYYITNTDLKDLGEVCVSVAEHGVDAVDGILGLARGASLGFGLQYWQ